MKTISYILILLMALGSCKKVEQDELTVQIFIPNAFRPSSNPNMTPCLDGNPNCNLAFYVHINSNGMSYSFDMSIYNKQQELVLKTSDSKNSWDGTVQNNGTKICPQGSYHYLIKVTELPSGKSKVFEGSVLLLR